MIVSTGPSAAITPSLDEDQAIRQRQHLVGGMTDIKDRDSEMPGHPTDEGKKLGLACAVQGRQRFVHQEKARLGQ